MQPVVFPDTKELVINSFENDKDYLIVVDIQTGELLSKVDVNARLANGMFLSPGFNRDIFIVLLVLLQRSVGNKIR